MKLPTLKKTVKALKGSIKKWEKIAAGKGRDKGTDNCPLCELFYNNNDDDGGTCAGCPVRAHVGDGGCRGTPYFPFKLKAEKLGQSFWEGYGLKANTKELKLLAMKEVKFLKSLLP